MIQIRMQFNENPWIPIRDGNLEAREIYNRHYSRRVYKDKRKPKKIIGPGYYILLILPKGEGLFAWRKFKDDCIDERTGLSQAGINNSIFRNEQPDIYLSSDLILWAEELAWERWPGERLYTYIDIKKIKKKETRDAVI